MKIPFFGRLIEVEVELKNIKHTYLHRKGEDHVLVTSRRLFDRVSLQKLLERNRAKVDRLLDKTSKEPLTSPGTVSLFQEAIPVIYENKELTCWSFTQGTLLLSGKDEANQKAALEAFYRFKVKEAAVEEMEKLQHTGGLHLNLGKNKFKVKRLKSRLGSYSQKTRTVVLNSLLGRFKREYLRIILIHELVHTRVSGHQADFYRLLLAFVPDYHRKKNELSSLIKRYEI